MQFHKSIYPSLEAILAKLKKVTDRVVMLDANQLAQEAGSLQAANVVMLGAMFGSGLLPVKEETIKAGINKRFPTKAAQTNIKAFDLGCQEVQRALKKAVAH